MKINSSELIDILQGTTKELIDKTKAFKQLSSEQLNYRNAPDSWSILECLEHLNLYGDFYLKEIEEKILKASEESKPYVFKSGWMGNYAANSMLPENGKLNKMKTFKDKNPIHSDLDATTIDRFIKQQERMLQLLEQARKINMNKVKTGITITNLIRFKLGDTFRFVINHNVRHIQQAERLLKISK